MVWLWAILEDLRESIVYFDKVLKIDPNNVPALNDNGISLADLGKYGEAIVYFDKSLKINGSNIYAMSSKARVFYGLGRYDELSPTMIRYSK